MLTAVFCPCAQAEQATKALEARLQDTEQGMAKAQAEIDQLRRSQPPPAVVAGPQPTVVRSPALDAKLAGGQPGWIPLLLPPLPL